MQAVWNGQIIAESDQTVEVEGNHYFPRNAVKEEFLVKSPTTSVCHWKGEARYFTLQVNEAENKDAAWYYPDPKDAAREIKDMVAFWKGVQVKE